MKEKLLKVGKTLGGVVCVVAGLAISGFGIVNLLPEKRYAKGAIPQKDSSEE